MFFYIHLRMYIDIMPGSSGGSTAGGISDCFHGNGRRQEASGPEADAGEFSFMRCGRAFNVVPALAAAALLLAACDEGAKKADAKQAAPLSPEVEIVTAEPKDLPIETEFAGRTSGSREVEVRARVSGILLQRTYVEGSRIREGEVLFRIDPKPYEVALQRAEARLQEAHARLRAGERDWQRAKTLFEKKAVSERARDDALSALDLAKASVALARADVNAARIDMDYTTVKAPIAGVTGLEAISEGSLIGTSTENNLLTRLTQLDPIRVNFAIPDAVWLHQRQLIESGKMVATMGTRLAAQIRLADGRSYAQKGHVDFTDTTVDRDTGTIQARAIFPNPEGEILPGQFVRIVLTGLVRKDAIVIPEPAVMQGPQGTFVYRLGAGNKAEAVPVKTGAVVAGGWIVEAGLSAGDRVVTKGVIRVRPGQPVRLAAANAPSSSASPASGTEGKNDGGPR